MEDEDAIPFEELLNEIIENKIFKRTLYLWLHYKAKLSIAEVQRMTGDNYKTIWRTKEKWKSEGIIEDKPRPGRPVEYDEIVESMVIEKQLDNRRKSIMSICNEMLDENLEVSYNQTKRIINKHFRTVSAPRSIQISSTNKKRRLEWMEEYSNWGRAKWRKVVWSDEKSFEICPQKHRVNIKLLPGEDKEDFPITRGQQGGQRLLFWGAINGSGQLYFRCIPGIINSESYCEFLRKKALPAIRKKCGRKFIFQQDNARPHRALKTQQFLESQGIEVLDWPSQSPDLNPIEQV